MFLSGRTHECQSGIPDESSRNSRNLRNARRHRPPGKMWLSDGVEQKSSPAASRTRKSAAIKPAHVIEAAIILLESSSQMRAAVLPSQSGGIFASAMSDRCREHILAACFIFSGSVPTRIFVPISIVIGRSVLCRSVRHGMPRTVVSSCKPARIGQNQFCTAVKPHKIEITERLDEPDI